MGISLGWYARLISSYCGNENLFIEEWRPRFPTIDQWTGEFFYVFKPNFSSEVFEFFFLGSVLNWIIVWTMPFSYRSNNHLWMIRVRDCYLSWDFIEWRATRSRFGCKLDVYPTLVHTLDFNFQIWSSSNAGGMSVPFDHSNPLCTHKGFFILTLSSGIDYTILQLSYKWVSR